MRHHKKLITVSSFSILYTALADFLLFDSNFGINVFLFNTALIFLLSVYRSEIYKSLTGKCYVAALAVLNTSFLIDVSSLSLLLCYLGFLSWINWTHFSSLGSWFKSCIIKPYMLWLKFFYDLSLINRFNKRRKGKSTLVIPEN